MLRFCGHAKRLKRRGREIRLKETKCTKAAGLSARRERGRRREWCLFLQDSSESRGAEHRAEEKYLCLCCLHVKKMQRKDM